MLQLCTTSPLSRSACSLGLVAGGTVTSSYLRSDPSYYRQYRPHHKAQCIVISY
jgi:hypothetical protein